MMGLKRRQVSIMPGGVSPVLGVRWVVVALLALTVGGCVSRAAMRRMGDQLDYLEASQRRMERNLIRIDSLVTESTQASEKTRADVGASLDEFKMETSAMHEAIDELRRQIERRPPQVVYQAPPGNTNASGGKAGDTAAAATPGTPPPDIDPSQLYENAFTDVRKGNYELAIQQFRDILEFFGGTDYAPNARYWIGESFYSMEQYDSALVQFDALITSFPQSDRLPTALYKMGRCYEELGRPRQARKYYQRVIDEYPNSLEAKPSQNRLSQIR